MVTRRLKIALLECDSSHTEAYSQLTNFADSVLAKYAIVNSIYSSDLSLGKTKSEKLQIPKVTSNLNMALEDIDCAMVIGRYADSHYSLARDCLIRDIPVFLDKPFVEKSSQLEDLIQISKDKGIGLMACSPFRFDEGLIKLKKDLESFEDIHSITVTGPFECNDLGDDPRLKDVFFYGCHATEIINEICGNGVNSVYSKENKLSVHGIFTYESGMNVSLNLIKGSPVETYRVYIMGKESVKDYTIGNININGLYYKNTLSNFLSFVRTQKTAVCLKSSLESFKMIEAFRKSFNENELINI